MGGGREDLRGMKLILLAKTGRCEIDPSLLHHGPSCAESRVVLLTL